MLSEHDLDEIERACTGPDTETFTGVVRPQVVLELVREIRARRAGRPYPDTEPSPRRAAS